MNRNKRKTKKNGQKTKAVAALTTQRAENKPKNKAKMNRNRRKTRKNEQKTKAAAALTTQTEEQRAENEQKTKHK